MAAPCNLSAQFIGTLYLLLLMVSLRVLQTRMALVSNFKSCDGGTVCLFSGSILDLCLAMGLEELL